MLAPGARINHYEIVRSLGAGGMGVVYRARDTKLNRDVALKVVAERFASDRQWLARITREAEALAAVSHHNVATIHSIEETSGAPVLVMELVEGPTLAERISQGPLPLDGTLVIARQIAAACDAAHARGIIHRDLKPANIKIGADGTVKVLDFGLAKLATPESAALHEPAVAAESATIFDQATAPGTILGTPAYMSPEQARGEPTDKRTDIWAFGVIVFELLTGVSPFARPSMAATIAAVLHEDPDWNRLPRTAQRLVQSCLKRDRRDRLRDIADAFLLIDEEDARRSEPTARQAPSRVAWIAAATCALIAAAFAWAPWRSAPPAAQPVRFHVTPGVELPASGASAISPDGRHLAFLGRSPDGPLRVWVRDLDSLADRSLTGSEVGQAAIPPFWSPDSRYIAFDAGGALKKIEVSGGLAHTLCTLTAPAIGGSWNREGTILFGTATGGILRVPETGGDAVPVTDIDRAQGEHAHVTPVFLADNRRFLYLRVWRDTPERTGLFVGSLDVSPEAQDRRRLLPTTTSVAYLPGRDGVGTLFYIRDGNLMTQAFDERRAELSGEGGLVAERVEAYRDTATVSASVTGVLVYRDAPSLQLTWLDRAGRVVSRIPEPGLYHSVALSADGTRALAARASSQVTSAGELVLFDFVRNTQARIGAGAVDNGVLSADGTRYIFEMGGAFYQGDVDRSSPPVLLSPGDSVQRSLTSWSPDGQYVMYTVNDSATGSDVWAISLQGQPTAKPFLDSKAAENQGQLARVGGQLWVAYTSNELGRDEVFLRRFPEGTARETVSRSGGHSPIWRQDSRELFYISADGTIMVTAFQNSLAGPPVPLFKAPAGFASRDSTGVRAPAPWGVTPDGQQFLFAAPTEAASPSRFTVVLNWTPSLVQPRSRGRPGS